MFIFRCAVDHSGLQRKLFCLIFAKAVADAFDQRLVLSDARSGLEDVDWLVDQLNEDVPQGIVLISCPHHERNRWFWPGFDLSFLSWFFPAFLTSSLRSGMMELYTSTPCWY